MSKKRLLNSLNITYNVLQPCLSTPLWTGKWNPDHTVSMGVDSDDHRMQVPDTNSPLTPSPTHRCLAAMSQTALRVGMKWLQFVATRCLRQRVGGCRMQLWHLQVCQPCLQCTKSILLILAMWMLFDFIKPKSCSWFRTCQTNTKGYSNTYVMYRMYSVKPDLLHMIVTEFLLMLKVYSQET